tara:strand:+ start:375 stop:1820 length:1446 start_codon:yes stop_codon:yes gene_type:complete
VKENKKNYLLLLCCLFLIFSTTDSENIDLELERVDQENINLSWNVSFEDFDTILLKVNHSDKTETYQIPIKVGSIQICCYSDEVTAILSVQITKAVDKTDESCSAEECVEYIKEVHQASKTLQAFVSPTTTTTTSTTTTTTTTTIPPPEENETFFSVEINNELITSIPLFDDVDFNNVEQNNIAIILTTVIIVLFYLVLLLQEWFNKILTSKRIKLFRSGNQFSKQGRVKKTFLIFFVLFATSFLIGYVEEGASLILDLENLAIFVAAFVGLVAVTLSYEGVEGLIESKVYNQEVEFRWAPQAIFFALISTLAFIYFNMPVGFIFGFIATSYIYTKRENAKLSPKFYSSIILSFVGFTFFYATSLPQVTESTVLTAIAAISYLMCLEGVIFKSLPGGGNDLTEALKDSRGIYRLFPILSFLLGVWLFFRILIIPPDSEFANFQQDLLSMGSFTVTFALILIVYILVLIITGYAIKFYGRDD